MNTQQFIKVFNPETAEKLKALGFAYMKENDVFVFTLSDELLREIGAHFNREQYVFDNKLCFS